MNKTPREILFERHRDAEGRLDAIRKRVLAQVLTVPGTGTEHASPDVARLLVRLPVRIWKELFWSCRRVWVGLAAAWLVMWGINSGLLDTPKTTAGARSASAPGLFEVLEEQRQLLAELIPSANSQPAEPPHSNPRPRSDRHFDVQTM